MQTSFEQMRSVPDLRVLDGIASWCGGLHGAMSLCDALSALAAGLGADSAAIARHHHRSEERPRLVALAPGRALLPRAFCQDVFGPHFGFARAGSIWFLSDMHDDPAWASSQSLDRWLSPGTIRDIAVIPMAVTRQSVDYVEFHFVSTLDRSSKHELEALVPTIERSWHGRQPGLVAKATLEGRAIPAHASDLDQRARWDRPILGMTNPAGLSRAEFRVCLLVSRGLSVKAVSDELGLTDNTVRSHLRAIYSKTETSGLSELIYLMLSVTDDEDEARSAAHRA